MKKLLMSLMISIFVFSGIAMAQAVSKRISSISVNFDNHTATITPTVGYYDNSGTWETVGVAESPVTLTDPAYLIVMSELAQANALNLNAIQSVIDNSI